MEVKCPKCGAPLTDGTCGYCGYKAERTDGNQGNGDAAHTQTGPAQEQWNMTGNPMLYAAGIIPGVSRKSRVTALLLCIFLGGLGAHRFYVGKVGTGILYLCTAGLFGIGWLIDIIRIVVGSFRDEFGLLLQ
ncbi:MAG TPA: TM2 domain-containing protein [Candidatus Mediterraneibacter merdipullorum]|nr:TM2 domain-containing protein [Candidatus Mediterraneibacter merdipullorum]